MWRCQTKDVMRIFYKNDSHIFDGTMHGQYNFNKDKVEWFKDSHSDESTKRLRKLYIYIYSISMT